VSKTSTATVGTTAWTYLVYSFNLTDATTKDVYFYIDNTPETLQSYSGIF
jgi:hypothetical protein